MTKNKLRDLRRCDMNNIWDSSINEVEEMIRLLKNRLVLLYHSYPYELIDGEIRAKLDEKGKELEQVLLELLRYYREQELKYYKYIPEESNKREAGNV